MPGIDPNLYAGLEALDLAYSDALARSRANYNTRTGAPSRVDSDLAVSPRVPVRNQASRAPWGSAQWQREQDLLDAVLRTNIQQQEQQVRQRLDDYFRRPFGADVLQQLEQQRKRDLFRLEEENLRRMQPASRAPGATGSGSRLAPNTPPAQRPMGATPRSAAPYSPPAPTGQRNSPLTQAPSRPVQPSRPPVSSPYNHPSNRTPNTSGSRAPLSARDTPRQARPSTWQGSRPPQSGQSPNRNVSRPANRSQPRSLPVSPVHLAGAGAQAGLDFGMRVVSGQDARTAGLTAAGTLGGNLLGGAAGGAAAGRLLGGLLGSTAGPVGTAVGGVVGGFVGGAAGGALGNLLFPSPVYNAPQLTPLVQGVPPFYGGQDDARAYRVQVFGIRYSATGGATGVCTAANFQSQIATYWGPIRNIQLRQTSTTGYAVDVLCRGPSGQPIQPLGWVGLTSVSSSAASGTGECPKPSIQSANVSPVDGLPDGFGVPERRPVPTRPPNLISRGHPANTPTSQYVPNPIASKNPSSRGDDPQRVPTGRLAPRQSAPSPTPAVSPLPIADSTPSPGNASRPSGRSGSSAGAGSSSSPSPSTPTSGDEAQPIASGDFGLENQTFRFPIGGFAVPFGLMRTGQGTAQRPGDRPDSAAQSAPGPNQPPPDSPNSPCSGNRCGTAIRYDIQNQGQRLDQLNAALNGLDLAALLAGLDNINRRLDVIDTKLGPQIPGGGLSGFLQQMQNFASRAWRFTRMDKIINLLTLMAALHNAAMLSRSLASTLGELTSQMLTVFGVRDEEGSPIDVNEVLSNSIESAIKAVVGEPVYNGVSQTWNKASRILSAASNIVWTIRSIQDSALEVSEWIAENTGRIGNALKRWGVVGERAYPWMTERIRAQDKWRRRFDRFYEGVENIEDAASSLSSVTSEVQEIQEEFLELSEARDRFAQSVTDFLPEEEPPAAPPDFVPIATATDEEKALAIAPRVRMPDLSRSPTQPTPEQIEELEND